MKKKDLINILSERTGIKKNVIDYILSELETVIAENIRNELLTNKEAYFPFLTLFKIYIKLGKKLNSIAIVPKIKLSKNFKDFLKGKRKSYKITRDRFYKKIIKKGE